MHKVRLSVEEFHDTGHDWQSELLVSGSLPAKLPTQNMIINVLINSPPLTSFELKIHVFLDQSANSSPVLDNLMAKDSVTFRYGGRGGGG